MKSIRPIHLVLALSVSLTLACDVTGDPVVPSGAKLTIKTPTNHALIKDRQDVQVAFDVSGFMLAAPGTCSGTVGCGHWIATVDGPKCNPDKATYAASGGVDKSFAINFDKCMTPFWGPHQINVELVTDTGMATVVDSRQYPVSDSVMVTAAATYVSAQKILSAKCTPCHTGGSSGGQNIGSVYADAIKAVSASAPAACKDKKVGECATIRIKDGSMPQGAGCTGDPTKDATNPACLTADEQAVLDSWASNGLLQN